jgi:hypothetical protein
VTHDVNQYTSMMLDERDVILGCDDDSRMKSLADALQDNP